MELLPVELVVGADATAQIEAERLHGVNRLRNVGRVEAAGKKERNRNRVSDVAAETPIVDSSRAAQFLHSEVGIARVEQECIDVWGHTQGILHGLRAGDVNHLYERDAGQCRT